MQAIRAIAEAIAYKSPSCDMPPLTNKMHTSKQDLLSPGPDLIWGRADLVQVRIKACSYGVSLAHQLLYLGSISSLLCLSQKRH